jgi:hypothetical protein
VLSVTVIVFHWFAGPELLSRNRLDARPIERGSHSNPLDLPLLSRARQFELMLSPRLQQDRQGGNRADRARDCWISA